MSCQQIVMSSSFFRFLAILEQSGSWIPDIYAKNADFLQKNAGISKIKRALVLKGIFSETTCVCTYVPTKFHVSSIILMSFRQGIILIVLAFSFSVSYF